MATPGLGLCSGRIVTSAKARPPSLGTVLLLFPTHLTSDQVLAIRGEGKGCDGFPARDGWTRSEGHWQAGLSLAPNSLSEGRPANTDGTCSTSSSGPDQDHNSGVGNFFLPEGIWIFITLPTGHTKLST